MSTTHTNTMKANTVKIKTMSDTVNKMRTIKPIMMMMWR